MTGFIISPRPLAAIPVPTYPKLAITANGIIGQINYSVRQVHPTEADLRISMTNAANPLNPPFGGARTATLQLTLPPGVQFLDCPTGCSNPGNGRVSSWHKALAFKSGLAGLQPNTVTAVFPVSAQSFSVSFNGLNAYAALPQVTYQLTGAVQGAGGSPTTPVFQATFQIPSADSYDWFGFPPTLATKSAATWSELLPITNGTTTQVTASGTNQAAESRRTYLIFLYGLILGIGGGAFVSAIQEALHIMFDAPGGAAADQVRRELTDRAHQEEQARQGQARREAPHSEKSIRDGVAATSTPTPEQAPAREALGAPRSSRADHGVSRRLAFTAVGAFVAVIGAIIAIIMALGTPQGPARPNASNSGGHIRWTQSVHGPVSGIAEAGGTVYINANNMVYALNAATGHLSWTQSASALAYSPPVAVGGTVYTNGNYDAYALDATTGHVRWRNSAAFEVTSSPAVASNAVFIGGSNAGGHGGDNAYRLSAATGHIRWAQSVGGAVNSLAVAGGTVYMGGDLVLQRHFVI
jgi:hypothetical protein